MKYLCEEATRAGTQGQRAEIFACEVARASAGERRVVEIKLQELLRSASSFETRLVEPYEGSRSNSFLFP